MLKVHQHLQQRHKDVHMYRYAIGLAVSNMCAGAWTTTTRHLAAKIGVGYIWYQFTRVCKCDVA